MAKISAHGDEKVAEWKSDSGCRMVLTKQGRVLRNYLKGDGLALAPISATVQRLDANRRSRPLRYPSRLPPSLT